MRVLRALHDRHRPRRADSVTLRPLPRLQATAVWDAVGAGLQPLLRGINAAIPRPLRTRPRPPRLPRPPAPQPETAPDALDALLARLDGAKAAWTRVGLRERARLLRRCTENFIQMTPEIAEVTAAAKGSYEGGLGDEMCAGPAWGGGREGRFLAADGCGAGAARGLPRWQRRRPRRASLQAQPPAHARTPPCRRRAPPRRVSVVPIVTGLYELERAMAAGGAPRPVLLQRRRGTGQWVARVWPSNMVNVFFPRFQGEVCVCGGWMGGWGVGFVWG